MKKRKEKIEGRERGKKKEGRERERKEEKMKKEEEKRKDEEREKKKKKRKEGSKEVKSSIHISVCLLHHSASTVFYSRTVLGVNVRGKRKRVTY